MMKTVTTFGEIMLRIFPVENGERLSQANLFKIEPGGSEANVAIALSNLGIHCNFITKLPDNPLTDKILMFLRQFNVNTSDIITGGTKLGTYWTENGIGPRNSNVIYDRNHTSFSEMSVEDFEWDKLLKDSSWFHFSGISPAISESVYNVLNDVVSKIKTPYSVDLNYRSKLWDWVGKDHKLINSTMSNLCKHAKLIAGNESDFKDILGIHVDSKSNDNYFDQIAENCFERFQKLEYISISNRHSISASSNIWNGVLFVRNSEDKKFIGKSYKIEPIKDRVGTGDSFVAGIIYGLINKEKYSFQQTVDFATTLSALNHTTLGDASRYNVDEVWKVIESKGTGHIIR